MTESVPLNNNPLNQHAKKLLAELKVSYSDHILYSLQLAHWMLVNEPESIPGVVPDVAWKLEIYAGEMLGWKPENAQDYLLNVDETPKGMSGATATFKLLEKNDLLSATGMGGFLAENLYNNLAEFHPSLQTP